MAAVKLKVGQEAEVALGALQPDPDQPRKTFNEDDLKVLAASIKDRGVLVPLIVRKGDKGALVIVDGERRWRAAKLANVRRVPVLLQDWGSFDAAGRAISQLAINNVREPLKPMELASLVHRLRTVEKLTTNDIAARLTKMGTPMAAKDISAAGDLLELPASAQEMLNEKQLDTAGARALLLGRREPQVIERATKALRDWVGLRGRVTARDAVQALEAAYDKAGIDLGRTWSYDKTKPAVHFDYRKACQGCEHLRKVGDSVFCMNEAEFKKRNAEAIEAGLGPGGKRPERPAISEKGADRANERAESREASHAQRVAQYLDAWLRRAIGDLLPARSDLVENLRDYFASAMPDGWSYSWGVDDEKRREGRAGINSHENRIQINKALADLMRVTQRHTISEFVGQPLSGEERLAIAQACVIALRPAQVLELAKAIGLDVGSSYSVDAAYLDLKTGPQLRALAEHSGVPDLQSKVGELREHLLKFENVQRIGLPPDLKVLLDAEPAPAPGDEIDDDLADEDGDAEDDWDDDEDPAEDLEDAA